MWERSRSIGVVFLLVISGACGSETVATTPLPGDGDAGGQARGDPSGGDTTLGDPVAGDAAGAGDTTAGDALGGDPSSAFTCSSCHGNDINDAPPVGLGGKTEVTDTGVGAHQSHVLAASWHRTVECVECHVVPQALGDAGHIDTPLPAELTWSFPANADGASVNWNGTTCTNYCHGQTLQPGGTLLAPEWTAVDGTQASCGTCHGLPPAGTHPASTACEGCHDQVISSYDDTDPPTSTWADPSLHIDGQVQLGVLGCTSCHGDASAGRINPPRGTGGETETTEAAVGAHEVHLASADWHRIVACTDCHAIPASGHPDGTTDYSWGGPSGADGASPTYDSATTTCNNVYCHGTTLYGAASGGTIARAPDWTLVDGTWDSCGDTCHTNPPGGAHPTGTNCEQCHGEVITSTTPSVVWNDPSRHIDGIKDGSGYHDLSHWTSPRDDTNHHGSNYFLTNQQRDEHDTACTACHGPNLTGGTSQVSCNNGACHGGSWRACDFCHGNPPPDGVAGETTTGTLAVGRHTAHVNASSSHVAYSCNICHVVPTPGNFGHAAQYVPSADLETAGHHGDVSFSGQGAGTTWNVDSTVGNPVTARGSCLGACHSNGRGGNPNVTPRWAGGTWTSACDNCHNDPPSNGEHNKHVNSEGIPCGICHDTSASAHVNGQTDVVISGGGDQVYDPDGCTDGNGATCIGTCHDGESHDSGNCW